MFTLSELESAANNIYQVMPATPQYNWPQLTKHTGCNVWVKHENHTPTGAFKVRGGIQLLSQLKQLPEQPQGIISATRGNHGQSLSFAGNRTDMPVTIVVPECNNPDQKEAISFYDPQTQWLLTGDTFYPGRLYTRQWKDYVKTIARLVEFSTSNKISAILGAHIEMSAQYGVDYPTGSKHQANEASLVLTVEDLKTLNQQLVKLGNEAKRVKLDKFIIYPVD